MRGLRAFGAERRAAAGGAALRRAYSITEGSGRGGATAGGRPPRERRATAMLAERRGGLLPLGDAATPHGARSAARTRRRALRSPRREPYAHTSASATAFHSSSGTSASSCRRARASARPASSWIGTPCSRARAMMRSATTPVPAATTLRGAARLVVVAQRRGVPRLAHRARSCGRRRRPARPARPRARRRRPGPRRPAGRPRPSTVAPAVGEADVEAPEGGGVVAQGHGALAAAAGAVLLVVLLDHARGGAAGEHDGRPWRPAGAAGRPGAGSAPGRPP